MTDTTCAAGTPLLAAPTPRSDSPFVSMSLRAADAFIVVACFVCTGGTASTAKRVPCGANRSGTSVIARHGQSHGVSSEEMFQVRILIRQTRPQHGIRCVAHRCRNACRTRRDGRRRLRVVVAVTGVRRNTSTNTLQGCDLAPVGREADAQLRVAMQGEYGCRRVLPGQPLKPTRARGPAPFPPRDRACGTTGNTRRPTRSTRRATQCRSRAAAAR